jgi:hypothetical protein
MINMTHRPNIDMRLRPLKLLFRHNKLLNGVATDTFA